MISEKTYCVEECTKLIVPTNITSNPVLMLGDITIKLVTTNTQFSGKRKWFVCPCCGDRRGILLVTPKSQLGCLGCLPVSYAKQRYKGMVEEGLYTLA